MPDGPATSCARIPTTQTAHPTLWLSWQRRASCASGPLAVGAPSHRLSSRAGMDLRDSLIHQVLIPPATGVRNDKAALPLLDHAAPSISSLRWVLWGELPILLWTKDQNSSISSSESLRSCTNTSVSASACSAARESQRPMVSYLWPVISSAALRLPRRITISSERPTSSGEV